jgi:hypothetical protein
MVLLAVHNNVMATACRSFSQRSVVDPSEVANNPATMYPGLRSGRRGPFFATVSGAAFK